MSTLTGFAQFAQRLAQSVAEMLVVPGFVGRMVRAVQIDPADLHAWRDVERQLRRHGAPRDSVMLELAGQHFAETLRSASIDGHDDVIALIHREPSKFEELMDIDEKRGGIIREFLFDTSLYGQNDRLEYIYPSLADSSSWFVLIDPRLCTMVAITERGGQLNVTVPIPISMWGEQNPHVPQSVSEVLEIERQRELGNMIRRELGCTPLDLHEFAVAVRDFLNAGLAERSSSMRDDLSEYARYVELVHDEWEMSVYATGELYDELLGDGLIDARSFVLSDSDELEIITYRPKQGLFELIEDPKALLDAPPLRYQVRPILQGPSAPGIASLSDPVFSSHELHEAEKYIRDHAFETWVGSAIVDTRTKEIRWDDGLGQITDYDGHRLDLDEIEGEWHEALP